MPNLQLIKNNQNLFYVLLTLVCVLGAYWYGGRGKDDGWNQFRAAVVSLDAASKEAANFRIRALKAESLLVIKDTTIARWTRQSTANAYRAQVLHDSLERVLAGMKPLTPLPNDSQPAADSNCAGWQSLALGFREEAGRWHMSYMISDSALRLVTFQRDSTRVLLGGALTQIDTLNLRIESLIRVVPKECKILFFHCPSRTTSFLGGAIVTVVGIMAIKSL